MLADVIAAHLATWDIPHVELAAFGTRDPQQIARAIDDACLQALGAHVATARFYASSIGAVAGVELADARAIVVKVHQPDVAAARLAAIARLRAHLPFSPRVLGDPIALPTGAHATFEELIDGERRDTRAPAIRRALADGLHAIVDAARPFAASAGLDGVLAPPDDRLWPAPHSKLFDFEATRAGAEWIDDVARAARDAIAPVGELVVAHGDWRAEHVRFARDEVAREPSIASRAGAAGARDEVAREPSIASRAGAAGARDEVAREPSIASRAGAAGARDEPRIVVAYDWDLRRDREPAIIGVAAHAFTADWSDESDRAQAPTLDDARAFVADYEAARGRAFDRAERRLCGAAFAYACAYTARCGHALGRARSAPERSIASSAGEAGGVDDRDRPGTFGALVASHGARLLAL